MVITASKPASSEVPEGYSRARAPDGMGHVVEPPVPNRAIKIAHVIHRLDVGGLENGLVNLINRMPAQRFRHVVICLTGYTDFKSRITRDVELYALHKQPGKDFGLYFRLWNLFRRVRPDIVHTRNLATLEAQLPAWLVGVPCRIHGEHGRDIHDLDNTRAKYRMLRAFFRPFVHRYIPLSLDLERYLREEVGVSENKIVPICNGVDTDHFRPIGMAKEFPEDVPECMRGGRLILGTVGRMEAVKDPLTLVRAFIELTVTVPDAKARLGLVMIGDGALRKQAQNLIDEAGLTEIAWLPGSRDDVPQLMRVMDVFVLPSLAEGISNTILEAMASGLPVVATDVGGSGELVHDGETGLLVPRDNPRAMAAAVRRYVQDGQLRSLHGCRAREVAEQAFSIRGMVERYTRMYAELCRQRLPHLFEATGSQ